jgi:SAM-dependent methyltransferase
VVYFFIRVAYVATPKKYFPEIFKLVEINSQTIIYDLGAGLGNFLFAAEKRGAGHLVGIEISPLHCWLGRLKAWLKKSKVKFIRQDFFATDLASADIIYLFLTPKILPRLWFKIKKEAKPGAQLIVLGEIKNQRPWRSFHGGNIYQLT